MANIITPQELRIGNWIYSFSEPVQVLEIEHNHLSFHADHPDGSITDGHLSIEDFHPIPLTPEILVKCGFYHDVIEDESHYKKQNSKYLFSISHIDEDWYLDGYFEYKPFQYLHQLQNVYFALTGNELEVAL